MVDIVDRQVQLELVPVLLDLPAVFRPAIGKDPQQLHALIVEERQNPVIQ